MSNFIKKNKKFIFHFLLYLLFVLGLIVGAFLIFNNYQESIQQLDSTRVERSNEYKLLTRDQVNSILNNAPDGLDKIKILDALILRGYNLEGVDNEKRRQELTFETIKDPEEEKKLVEENTYANIITFLLIYLGSWLLIISVIKIKLHLKKETTQKRISIMKANLKRNFRIIFPILLIFAILVLLINWIAGLAATTIIIILLILILLK